MEFLGGVLAGIFVALIVQLVTAVHLRPILDIREIIGEVAVSLIYYANVYGQLGAAERKKEAQEAFLEHGSKLRAKANSLFCGNRLCVLGLLPRRTNLFKASWHLIGLSNWAGDGTLGAPTQATRDENAIKELLGIKTDDEM